jgi:hypothetical protein
MTIGSLETYPAGQVVVHLPKLDVHGPLLAFSTTSSVRCCFPQSEQGYPPRFAAGLSLV